MRKVVFALLLIIILGGCGASKNIETYSQDETNFENQASYETGYEDGYQAGIEEGARNAGDYLDEDYTDELDDIIESYSDEYGYYKAN